MFDYIVVTIQNGLVIDGVHRGIAFLRCVNKGVKETSLPDIILG